MISEEFARCLAKICGDGSVNSKYLRYNNTSDVLLEEFETDMEAVFGNIHLTKGKGGSGTRFLQASNKTVLAEFFKHLNSFKSKDIFIPQGVLRGNIKIQSAFIRAFYDDEGCASLRLNTKTGEWKRNITVSSNSKQILQDIKNILLSLDIYSSVIFRNRPKSDYDLTYVVSITGRRNFLLFKQYIGFKHPRKSKMLELIVLSYSARRCREPSEFNKLNQTLKNLEI